VKFFLKVLHNSSLAKELKKALYNGTPAGCRKRTTLMFPAVVWQLEEMYDGRINVLLRLCMMNPIMVMDKLKQERFDYILISVHAVA
jgi:hypothetical protein